MFHGDASCIVHDMAASTCRDCLTISSAAMRMFRGRRDYKDEPFGMPRHIPLAVAERFVASTYAASATAGQDYFHRTFGDGERKIPEGPVHKAADYFFVTYDGYVQVDSAANVMIRSFGPRDDGIRIMFHKIARGHLAKQENPACLLMRCRSVPTPHALNRARLEVEVFDSTLSTFFVATYLVALTRNKGFYVGHACRYSFPDGAQGSAGWREFAAHSGRRGSDSDDRVPTPHKKALTDGFDVHRAIENRVEEERLAAMGKNERAATVYGGGPKVIEKARAQDRERAEAKAAAGFQRFVTFAECGHTQLVAPSDSAYHTVEPGVESYKEWSCGICSDSDEDRTVVQVEDRYPVASKTLPSVSDPKETGPYVRAMEQAGQDKGVGDMKKIFNNENERALAQACWSAAVKVELARREAARKLSVQTEVDADTDNW